MDDLTASIDSIASFFVDDAHGLSSPTDADLPGIGSVVAERYVLERFIGRGGMGAVFAGRDVLTGKRVALKLLRGDPVRNRDAALRMSREARAVGRINHPNVVAVYDSGVAAERPYIAMELLEGESLEQRIARTGPMSESDAIATLRQIARGVEAAHANGIIHRDLKPANVLMCAAEGGHPDIVKVLDFGVSKLLGDAEEDVMVTGYGVQLGTPVFMSPEQVRGDRLDERADVYALAVILYFVLTQRLPFHASSRGELFAKILNEAPVPLAVHRPDISPAIAAVVLKGLARDRGARYESVAALADALSLLATAPQLAPRSRARASRVMSLAAALSGIVLTFVPVPTTSLHTSAVSHDVAVVQPRAAEPSASPVTPPESPSVESVCLPSAQPQPSAQRALPATRVRKRMPKHSPPQPSVDSAAVVPDGQDAREVKLMSW